MCWVSQDNIRKIFNYEEGETDAILTSKQASDKQQTVSLSQFFPTYPNKVWSGIGKGHSYAIKFLFRDFLDVDQIYDKNTIPKYKL